MNTNPKLKKEMIRVDGEEVTVTRGTGNVFADLGRPDADELLQKAKLVSRIDDIVRARRLTQAAAGKILGIDQANVSRLLRGHLKDFSIERLMHFLTLLGKNVEIRVTDSKSKHGRLRVA